MQAVRYYLKAPFAKTSALFAMFIFSYIFLIRLIPPQLVTLMAAVGVGLFLFEVIQRNLMPVFFRKVGPMVPWIAFVVLSLLVLPLIPFAASRVWNNFTGITLVVIVFFIVRRYGRILFIEPLFMSYVFLVIVFFVLFPGILGVLETNSQRLSLNAEVLGTGGTNPNDVARMLGVSGMMMVLSLRLRLANFTSMGKGALLLNILRIVAILAAMFTIIFHSGSRSGLVWIATIVGFAFAARYSKNLFLAGILCGLGATTVIGILYVSFPELPIFNRITILFDEVSYRSGGEASAEARFLMITDGLKLWSESPIWGKGNEAFRVYSEFGTYSHSNYIEMLVNYGLLGIFTFYLPFLLGVIHSWNLRKHVNEEVRRQALWALICCLTLFILSFVNVLYYTRYMLIFYGVVLGKIYFLRDNSRRFEQMALRPPPARVR